MFKKVTEKIIANLVNTQVYYLTYRVLYLLRTLLLVKPRLHRSLKTDIISLDKISSTRPLVVVPILETNHYQHIHILAMAKAFSLRGYDVLVIVCDEYLPACELKSCRTENNPSPCFVCTTNRSHILDLFGLNYLTLSAALSEVPDPISFGQKIINEYGLNREKFEIMIEDSVTRYFYGAEDTFPQDAVDKVRSAHTESASISLALGDMLLKTYRPSICFNNMNVYSAWGPLVDLLESQGVVPIMLSMTAFNLRGIRLNYADMFRHNRTFERFLAARNNTLLNCDEAEILSAFLQNRRMGNDDLMKEWDFFDQSPVGQLGINSKKRNVFLFPNIPWDQGLNEFTGAFGNVIEWVESTIDYYSGHNEIDLWVKPHPMEVRGTVKSGKSVSDFIRTKYPVLPKNIHLIDADLGINTYHLFPFIDLGVVLTGTLGLEMALENIDVVFAGVNPCYGLGFLSEPKNKKAYFEAIGEWDNSPKRKDELVRFGYFYFINQCFSWPLSGKVWGDDLRGFSFSKVSDLATGKIADLDSIFEEIEFLIEDFEVFQQRR